MLAALSQRMFQDINASSLQITMIINKQKKYVNKSKVLITVLYSQVKFRQ